MANMADAGKKPPDRGGGKFYKCHSDTRVNAVVCLICEDVYHPNDFARKNCGVQLSETFVICKEHNQVNITSNDSEHMLEPGVKNLIAHIKNAAKIEILNKENSLNKFWQNKYAEQNRKIKEQEELIQQLEQDKVTQLQMQKIKNAQLDKMDLDQTLHDDVIFNIADMECLKKENKFLKDMNNQLKENNTEIKEKNEMLKQMLKDKENIRNLSKRNYAEVVTRQVQKDKKPPRIVIKKTEDCNETLQDITKKVSHYLIKHKDIQTNNIVKREKKEEVIITCRDEQSVAKAVEILKQKVRGKVAIEEKNKPKMKIVGINNFENMNDIQLQMDINERNFARYKKEGCKILHTYINKMKGTQSVLIEMTTDIHKHIKENNNKIYVGHQKCMAYDVIDIKPCYICGRFGHKGKNCRNKATCIKCAGPHKASECDAVELTCANCLYSNNKFKTKYNTCHAATEYENCEVFKSRVKKYIDTTDYSIKPEIPRDIGKVGNYLNKPMSTRQSGISIESLNSMNENMSARHMRRSVESLNSVYDKTNLTNP